MNSRDWEVIMFTTFVAMMAIILIFAFHQYGKDTRKYTIHENQVTGEVYVQLHDWSDIDHRRITTGAPEPDKIYFDTVDNACDWVAARKAEDKKMRKLEDAWREIKCREAMEKANESS